MRRIAFSVSLQKHNQSHTPTQLSNISHSFSTRGKTLPLRACQFLFLQVWCSVLLRVRSTTPISGRGVQEQIKATEECCINIPKFISIDNYEKVDKNVFCRIGDGRLLAASVACLMAGTLTRLKKFLDEPSQRGGEGAKDCVFRDMKKANEKRKKRSRERQETSRQVLLGVGGRHSAQGHYPAISRHTDRLQLQRSPTNRCFPHRFALTLSPILTPHSLYILLSGESTKSRMLFIRSFFILRSPRDSRVPTVSEYEETSRGDTEASLVTFASSRACTQSVIHPPYLYDVFFFSENHPDCLEQ